MTTHTSWSVAFSHFTAAPKYQSVNTRMELVYVQVVRMLKILLLTPGSNYVCPEVRFK